MHIHILFAAASNAEPVFTADKLFFICVGIPDTYYYYYFQRLLHGYADLERRNRSSGLHE